MLLRHGPTAWNDEGRIQGQLDLPLSEAGREQTKCKRIPAEYSGFKAFSSPLERARETASLMGLRNVSLDVRLIEHHWGRWQGMTRAEILAKEGDTAFEIAGRGIDFRPPGGESTSDLLARTGSFFCQIASSGHDAIAVTHRGVLRSAYALATGWTMLAPMPQMLDLSKIMVLSLDRAGHATIEVLNRDFERRD
ncbi:MAG: histidine phosphatase family protein [Alphaproteobacteria bacterium]|nr:histidine phosphatase family protein [Alphaproteobacteria bacterium]